MKTIGLLGGMSWESSIEYYRIINQVVNDRLGGVHSAKSVMVSVDFAEIEAMQHRGDWLAASDAMISAAKAIEAAGADFLVICTNTMHKLAPDVQAQISIPLLHIADPTGAAIIARGFRKVALLGTRFTMEEDFYKRRLIEKFDLDVIVPEPADRAVIHRVIYDELVVGSIRDDSRDAFLAIIDRLRQAGAQCVILGCTEIGLLVKQPDCELPLFDTTLLHALGAVDEALA